MNYTASPWGRIQVLWACDQASQARFKTQVTCTLATMLMGMTLALSPLRTPEVTSGERYRSHDLSRFPFGYGCQLQELTK